MKLFRHYFEVGAGKNIYFYYSIFVRTSPVSFFEKKKLSQLEMSFLKLLHLGIRITLLLSFGRIKDLCLPLSGAAAHK